MKVDTDIIAETFHRVIKATMEDLLQESMDDGLSGEFRSTTIAAARLDASVKTLQAFSATLANRIKLEHPRFLVGNFVRKCGGR